jgi:hypothetical protein
MLIFYYHIIVLGHIVTFTKVVTIYHSLIHYLHHSPLLPPFPIPGIVSTCLIFPFSCMNEYYFCYIHLPTNFPPVLTPPTSANPQAGPILSARSLFLIKGTFVCVRYLYREFHYDISMCVYRYIYYIYIYYRPNWFNPSIFLL